MGKHTKPRTDAHKAKLSARVKERGGIADSYKYTDRSEARRKDWLTRERPTTILRSPSGTLHRVRNMKLWCERHGLFRSAMSQMIRDAAGDTPKYGRNHHKNWTVVRVVKHRNKSRGE